MTLPAQADLARRDHAGMNKLELRYAHHLEKLKAVGELHDWEYEAIKLKLGKGAYYTPDFLVIGKHGSVEFHETKGFWREAARVRIKTAARLYPWFHFIAITEARDGWRAEAF